jgi:hypothetical protein
MSRYEHIGRMRESRMIARLINVLRECEPGSSAGRVIVRSKARIPLWETEGAFHRFPAVSRDVRRGFCFVDFSAPRDTPLMLFYLKVFSTEILPGDHSCIHMVDGRHRISLPLAKGARDKEPTVVEYVLVAMPYYHKEQSRERFNT